MSIRSFLKLEILHRSLTDLLQIIIHPDVKLLFLKIFFSLPKILFKCSFHTIILLFCQYVAFHGELKLSQLQLVTLSHSKDRCLYVSIGVVQHVCHEKNKQAYFVKI